MKSKTKYILLTLVIVSFALLFYSNNNYRNETSFDPTELKLAKAMFVIGLLSAGLYFFNKKMRNMSSKIMFGAFGICLVLNLYMVSQIYESIQIQKKLSEYAELETCEQMQKRFTMDLKNGEIKYFRFGLVNDMKLEKTLKKKFGIVSFGIGCTVYS